MSKLHSSPSRRWMLSILAVALVSARAMVGMAADEAADATTAETRFDQLKALVGEWTGKASHGGAPFETSVVYRLTAAGSAVQETLFPGTNHEMVTMYHQNGKELLLTHYCAAGNQPRMKAEMGKDSKKLVFRFLDGTNLQPDKDFHMHEGTIEFVDADHIKAEWVSFKDGKPAGAAKFDLQRKKKSAP